MSAMIGVVQADRVHLLADAAVFPPGSDRLKAVAEKILRVPDVNAVFTARGAGESFGAFMAACSAVGAPDFDSFVDRLPAVLEIYDAAMQPFLRQPTELLIAGWSTRRGAPMLLYRAMHDLLPGATAGEVYEVACFTTGDVGDMPADLATFTVADGVAAMEKARRAPAASLGTQIGGFVMHAIVSAEGPPVYHVPHRWPDVIGERLKLQGA
ncbi:hypothetical protein [Hansschlegelia zhihuaiae]|uniref:Uncharacterized protein n=1 Tax=Hansschlegelia zhihuaiae TaxID=405005 RepID=A0A4Q0MAY9_9HYPH|nr:hypothetical protein [Hansschlegelia zhihuaiae]RXF70265.1 hypothetical protein EK403_17050 [Hansschlegelia zhihuaiae]